LSLQNGTREQFRQRDVKGRVFGSLLFCFVGVFLVRDVVKFVSQVLACTRLAAVNVAYM